MVLIWIVLEGNVISGGYGALQNNGVVYCTVSFWDLLATVSVSVKTEKDDDLVIYPVYRSIFVIIS